MRTNSLLASLLLAASTGLGAAPQAAEAGTCTPAQEVLTERAAVAPAFSIDANGALDCGELADQSPSPWNFQCLC